VKDGVFIVCERLVLGNHDEFLNGSALNLFLQQHLIRMLDTILVECLVVLGCIWLGEFAGL
jgi:hypothetical protein